MKPKCFFMILLYFCLFVINQNSYSKEVGDILYEIKSKEWGAAYSQYNFNEVIGHAMIFAGTDEDGIDWVIHAPAVDEDGNPKKLFFEPIQASGYDGILEDFKCFSGTTKEQRKKIVSFGYSKRGAPYPSPGSKWYFLIDKPTIEQQKGYELFNGNECYSCVGIVERCYEEAQVGGVEGPTPNGFGRDLVREYYPIWPIQNPLYTTWNEAEGSYVSHDAPPPYYTTEGWVFFPYTQWYKQDTILTVNNPIDIDSKMRMIPSVSTSPTINLVAPAESEVIPMGISKYNLKATATDGVNGSGIFKVEFYLDNATVPFKVYTYKDLQGNPVFYYENESVPIELSEYTYEMDISNLSEGEHKIIARAVDRAGNWSSDTLHNLTTPQNFSAIA